MWISNALKKNKTTTTPNTKETESSSNLELAAAFDRELTSLLSSSFPFSPRPASPLGNQDFACPCLLLSCSSSAPQFNPVLTWLPELLLHGCGCQRRPAMERAAQQRGLQPRQGRSGGSFDFAHGNGRWELWAPTQGPRQWDACQRAAGAAASACPSAPIAGPYPVLEAPLLASCSSMCLSWIFLPVRPCAVGALERS